MNPSRDRLRSRGRRAGLALALTVTGALCQPRVGAAESGPRLVAGREGLPLERTATLPAGVAGVPADPSQLPPLRLELPYVEVDGDRIVTKATALSETFEGSFPGARWTLFNLGASDVGWGKSTRRRSEGSASGWCAGGGTAAPPPGGPIRNDMEAWMVAGPFDLRSVTSGSLSFDLFLDTETNADLLWAGASIDFPNFHLLGRGVDTNGFERFTIDLQQWSDLGDITGRNDVYFAFLFTSDHSIGFEGAYLDRISLDVDTSSGLDLLINQVDVGNCPTLRAFVSVTDGQGNPITGLTSSNFSLNENGSSQPVTSQPATGSGAALATTLVLDGSGSLSSADVANIKSASKSFIDLLESADKVAVYHFGSDVALVRDYTTNKGAAKAAVDTLTNLLGATSLYDAVVEAANHSLSVGGRRALLLMTDGGDNDSAATEQQAIAAAVAAGVPVFTIGFGSIDEDVLRRLATQTGGLFFRGASSADLQTILNRIGQALSKQYVLEWAASQRDGGTHPITIQVRRQGQTASRSTTYSLASSPCANATPCVANDRTLCLNGGRFKVQVEWKTAAGNSGNGHVATCGADDSGIFWFFADDNWEMLVKVLDGCVLTGHYWVFLAATTDVGYTLTVTDTQTGKRKAYRNAVGVASPAVTDTAALATCP